MPNINNTRTNTDKQHAVALILGAILGDDDVHGGLGGGVERGDLDVVAVDELEVGVTARQGDYFFGFRLQDQREEEVEEVDVAYYVGLHELVGYFF